MSTNPTEARKRVKLYALNANRQWDDKGTGHVTSCYHEPLDGMSLLVRNESDGSLLLESKIHIDTHYQKQQGTLIVWTESDNYDLALSFQEQDGCNEIWEKICQVQGRDPSYEQDNDEEQEEVRIDLVECDQANLQSILDQITAFSQTARRRDVLASEFIENDYVPKLLEIFKQADEKQDISILHKLHEIFKNLFMYDRSTLTEIMLSENSIMDVIGVFEYEQDHQEDQEHHDELYEQQREQQQQPQPQEHQQDHIEHIEEEQQQHQEHHQEPQEQQDYQKLSEENQEQKEHKEPLEQQEHPEHQDNLEHSENQEREEQHEQHHQNQQPYKRKRHREFLLSGSTFKEVIPFSNQKLVDKIHQTYRMQYLQSSVLPTPSILEENAYASLTNILFFNKVEIVSLIQEDSEFLQNLFNQIISNETSLDKKRELVSFLREYCIFAQAIQPKQRESFFKTLASHKILSAVEVALYNDDPVIKSAAIDIFTYLVEQNPHMTREHAVQQREGGSESTANILKSVIEHITTDQDPELGTATQLSCIVRLLLDPENMPGDAIGKHTFIEFFYHTCMQSLVEPIKQATTTNGDIEPAANDRKSAQLICIMLELLIFFMEHHFSQLRNYILNSDLLSRITSLIKSRHKFLVLSVIRFLRRLVATKDEVYLDLIMNEDLFSPVIQVLKSNNGRYNLLDSAILELFEFIIQSSSELLPLINYILTNFGPFLDSIDYVDTFKVMRQRGGVQSREEMESIWLGPAETQINDVNEVETQKHLDPDSSGALVDPESDDIGLPELELNMKEAKDEDEDVEEDEDEDAEDEDDIQMDELDDELEPQSKRKKTE